MPQDLDIGQLVNYLSWGCILAGSFFVLVGALGLIRMPDMYTRLHAASVTDTVGAGFLILGMMLQAGFTLITLKLVFVAILIFITTPVASHALAQAALHEHLQPFLAEDRREREIPELEAEPQSEDEMAAQMSGTDEAGGGDAAHGSAGTLTTPGRQS